MSTKLHTEDGKEIVVVDHIYERGGISVSPITKAQLVAALIAEGGEIVEPSSYEGEARGVLALVTPTTGRYLIFPIPAENPEGMT